MHFKDMLLPQANCEDSDCCAWQHGASYLQHEVVVDTIHRHNPKWHDSNIEQVAAVGR